MSFELKPQVGISIFSNLEDIVWTQSRDHVPPLLQGRVNESTWQRTFDAVRGQYETLLHKKNKMMPWVMIPCFVCCSMPMMIKVSMDLRDSWIAIAQSQAEIYRKAGVQVTLAKELKGSDGNMSNSIVGLRFEIGPSPANMSGNTSGPTTTSYKSYSGRGGPAGGRDTAARLRQIEDLYRTGSLSPEEYGKARERIINQL